MIMPAPTRTASAVAPIPVPRRAPQRHMRPGLVALAVALIAVGGLAAAYAVTLVGSTRTYLAVARPVAVGAALVPADVTTVRITTDPGLRPISATNVDRVVGRHAAVALVPGTLLTGDQLTDVPIPGPGQSLVGLGLPEDRLPASRVKPGSAVTLVATTQTSGVVQPDSTSTGPPPTFPAVVVDVRKGVRDGTLLINVTVSKADAATVAALAASDRIVIVLGEG